ncbi:MAG TPA: hypothetical protein P5137_09660 [Candidatus Brocadiia bacterium]|nr:hypothetical protein [Candidatus Brocadiia bacterium]
MPGEDAKDPITNEPPASPVGAAEPEQAAAVAAPPAPAPEDAVAMANAQALADEGRFDEAQAVLDEIARAHPDSSVAGEAKLRIASLRAVAEAIEGAKRAVLRGGFDEALAALDQALKANTGAVWVARLKRDAAAMRESYMKAMDGAERGKIEHRLPDALKCAETACRLCPNDPRAARLAAALSEEIDRAGAALQEAKALADAACFDQAAEKFKGIRELWPRFGGVEELESSLSDRRGRYQAALADAKRSRDKRSLEEAAQHGQQALKECPASEEAKRLLSEIEQAMAHAAKLVEDASAATDAAKFREAAEMLGESRRAWPAVPRLREIDDKLTQAMPEYEKRMIEARTAKEVRDLARVLELANRALSVCPASAEAAELIKTAKNGQLQAAGLLRMSKSFLSQGKFDAARERAVQARAIWPGLAGVDMALQQVDSFQTSYEEACAEAERALSRSRLVKASLACEEALRICPESEAARNLSRRIEEARVLARAQGQDTLAAVKALLKVLATIIMLGLVAAVAGAPLAGLFMEDFWPWCVRTQGYWIASCVATALIQALIHKANKTHLASNRSVWDIFLLVMAFLSALVIGVGLVAAGVFHAPPANAAAAGLLFGFMAAVLGVVYSLLAD